MNGVCVAPRRGGYSQFHNPGFGRPFGAPSPGATIKGPFGTHGRQCFLEVEALVLRGKLPVITQVRDCSRAVRLEFTASLGD